GDVNADGLADLIVGTAARSHPEIRILNNAGVPVFAINLIKNNATSVYVAASPGAIQVTTVTT
ncbi:MAG TPA: hypothetical protein VIL86_09660, partial [Tepidisphaeraceae bacterium]